VCVDGIREVRERHPPAERVQESRHGGQTPGLRAGARDTRDHAHAARAAPMPAGAYDRSPRRPDGRAGPAGCGWVVDSGPWLSRHTGFLPDFGSWRRSSVTGIMWHLAHGAI